MLSPLRLQIIKKPTLNATSSKLCPKISQSKSLAFLRFTGRILYFLRFLFFPSNLHTVEITGSNPVSPFIILPL